MVTLVLRVWRADPPRGTVFRYEATHVQTGDVAYFRSFESAAQHIRRLVERLPIQFPATGGVP